MRPPIRLAVLKCDYPLPKTEAKYGTFGGLFKALLNKAAKTLNRPDIIDPDAGLEISEFDVIKEEYPALQDVDAVLITGSKSDAFDQIPWIVKLVDFTASVLAQDRVRVIGVCFGHQIIGRALGVKVGRSGVGWEASVHPLVLSDKGKEVFGVEQLSIMEMHQDMVFELPPNTTCLASTPKCAIQGMYSPHRFISVQGHPEFDEEIVTEILQVRRSGYPPDVFDNAMKAIGNEQHGVIIAQGFLKFLSE